MPPAATKKAAASKKGAAKKAPASKKAASSNGDGELSPREILRQENLELGERIVEMRDNDGQKWGEIAEALDIGQGKAMLLYMYASVPEDERITANNDEQLGKKIVKARNDGLSWGQIMARTGLGEGKCRSLFEAASGETALGNRIGKGGRYPSGEGAPAKKAGVAKKAAKTAKASKAARTEAAAAKADTELPPKGTPLADFTLPQLKKRLEGATVTITNSAGKAERIRVKTAKSVKNGELTLTDDGGKTRVIALATVKSASQPK